MKKNIGFIGCGKMASAIIKGVIAADKGNNYIIKGAEIDKNCAISAQERLGIEVFSDNKELVKASDIVFIATRPNVVLEICEQIKSVLPAQTLVVSIAAGVSTKKIENILENNRVLRIMPNTPALVKLGMYGICKGSKSTEQDVETIIRILSSTGKCIEVEQESQMDIITAISGSGPAFFYQVIEDMARAGEKLGLDYEKSLLIATQTAMGSAQMIFDRGETTVQTLVDNVATKGGCTYEGIQVMKKCNSKEFFYEVIEKTTEKAHALGE